MCFFKVPMVYLCARIFGFMYEYMCTYAVLYFYLDALIFVCVYLCTNVHMFEYTYVYLYAFMYALVHGCMNVCMYA